MLCAVARFKPVELAGMTQCQLHWYGLRQMDRYPWPLVTTTPRPLLIPLKLGVRNVVLLRKSWCRKANMVVPRWCWIRYNRVCQLILWFFECLLEEADFGVGHLTDLIRWLRNELTAQEHAHYHFVCRKWWLLCRGCFRHDTPAPPVPSPSAYSNAKYPSHFSRCQYQPSDQYLHRR